MLVKELRKEVDKYNKNDLVDIVVELYKKIPKNKKEDYDIDNYIINKNKKVTKKEESYDIDSLSKEFNEFLYYVDNDYYASPNKIIGKNERSKWRFKVKKYYKLLNEFKPDTVDGRIATELLIELFERLSLGTVTLKFSNWETFRAVGISQSDYYDTIVKRIFSNSYNEENIKMCIEVIDVEKSPYELGTDMYDVLISNLPTSDVKLKTIELLEELIKELYTKKKETKNERSLYYIKEEINNVVYSVTNIYFILCEMKKGIDFFQKYYIHYNKEIKEYILLEIIEEYEDYKTWVEEYESHNYDYRDTLREKYKEYKKGVNK